MPALGGPSRISRHSSAEKSDFAVIASPIVCHSLTLVAYRSDWLASLSEWADQPPISGQLFPDVQPDTIHNRLAAVPRTGPPRDRDGPGATPPRRSVGHGVGADDLAEIFDGAAQLIHLGLDGRQPPSGGPSRLDVLLARTVDGGLRVGRLAEALVVAAEKATTVRSSAMYRPSSSPVRMSIE